jgi:methionine-rich copper-binding protein CopC
LRLRALESRNLPSAVSWPGLLSPVAEAGPTDVLTNAQPLPGLESTGRAEVVGVLGDGPYGAAEVDWYTFTLQHPASVQLRTLDRQAGSPLVTVLSLYNSDAGNFSDPYDWLQHRLLAQSDGAARGGDAQLTDALGPGTYFVAVSGSGNDYFHPLLAGSGYPGSTGPYGLLITATDLPSQQGAGPVVVNSDPSAGAVLSESPFVLRVDFSEDLNPATITFDQPGNTLANPTVRLTYTAPGGAGNGGQDVLFTGSNFSTATHELELCLAAPLMPGSYRLTLAGDAGGGNPVLRDTGATPLGADAFRPAGADDLIAFAVNGIKGIVGGVGPDDTPATARQLGDVTQAGLLHVAGAIGTDPTDPVPFDPNEVDLYHFQVSGPGRFEFGTEVFAGRIGSPLDPAVSLYRPAPGGQGLVLLAANRDTQNGVVAGDGSPDLYTDAAVFAGLTAGDYYVAVSSGGNVPDYLGGVQPGADVFDPTVSRSGQGGNSVGVYVLNLLVQPANTPPRVTAVSIAEGGALSAPPTELTVQFSEPVNLQQLAAAAYQPAGPGVLSPVYVEGPGGATYFPRFESFDPNTNQARFLMLDRLTPGAWALHLSGRQGLTDLAGNPLVGNDASGDFVVRFSVNAAPVMEMDAPPGLKGYDILDLGVLFPHELQAGVTLPGPVSGKADRSACFAVQVLQNQLYVITLTGGGDLSGARVLLMDGGGSLPESAGGAQGNTLSAYLPPGVYLIGVSGVGAGFQMHMTLDGDSENPPPLTVGPAPALRIRPVTAPGMIPPAASVPPSLPAQLLIFVPNQPGGSTDGSLPTVAGVPAGVASSLEVGPVGGVPVINPLAPPLTDYLFVRTDESSLMEDLFRSTVMTEFGQPDVNPLPDGMDGTTEASSPAPPPNPEVDAAGQAREQRGQVGGAPATAEAADRALALQPAPAAAGDGAPASEVRGPEGAQTESVGMNWSWVVALAAVSATTWLSRPNGCLAAWRRRPEPLRRLKEPA